MTDDVLRKPRIPTLAEIIASLPPVVATDDTDTYNDDDHDNPDGMTPEEAYNVFLLGLTVETRRAMISAGAKARSGTVAPTPAPASQRAATIDVEARARAVAEKLTNTDTGAPTAKGTTATRKRKRVNAAMMTALQADVDRMWWTREAWATYLRCAPSSISNARTWKQIMTLRESTRREGARDE